MQDSRAKARRTTSWGWSGKLKLSVVEVARICTDHLILSTSLRGNGQFQIATCL